MITLELFFKALPHIVLLVAVVLAARARTPDDILKWQLWAILFTLAIIADKVAL
jgi:hypothetical protein